MIDMDARHKLLRGIPLTLLGLAASAMSTACAAGPVQFAPVPVEQALPGGECEAGYPLSGGQALFLCDRSVVLTPSSALASHREMALRLEDDRLLGVSEIEVSPARIPLGAGTLRSIVLLDLGDEGCFGTYILGLADDGSTHRWGIVDEVADREGDIACASSQMSVRFDASAASAMLLISGPVLLPKSDGTYESLSKNREHLLIEAGQFIPKHVAPRHKPSDVQRQIRSRVP